MKALKVSCQSANIFCNEFGSIRSEHRLAHPSPVYRSYWVLKLQKTSFPSTSTESPWADVPSR